MKLTESNIGTENNNGFKEEKQQIDDLIKSTFPKYSN